MSLTEDFLKLKEELDRENTRRIRAEERYAAAKKALVDIIDKIKKAGYDPATLKKDVEAKEEELRGRLGEFRLSVDDMKAKLDEIEG